MSKMVSLIFICMISFLMQCAYAAATSPVGYWQTIDDVTHKPKSIIKISSNSDNSLSGQVVKIYPRPGHNQDELCTACTGARHNQHIVGMVILEGLKQSNNPKEWSEGSILDPLNGKTYHSLIAVLDNGQQLNVRGYIGLPMFGRTQTWIRVSEHDAQLINT